MNYPQAYIQTQNQQNDERIIPLLLLTAAGPAFYGGYGFGGPWYGFGRPGYWYGRRPWYGFGRRPWYGFGRRPLYGRLWWKNRTYDRSSLFTGSSAFLIN